MKEPLVNNSLPASFFLLHAADVLLSLGIIILLCVVLLVVMSAIASRVSKAGRPDRGSVGGLNRAERRKEWAMNKRKR